MMREPLLKLDLPRTLDQWVARFSAAPWQGASVEGWLFEDARARRAAETQLQQVGVQARFRSAYKPLVHYFLEELNVHDIAAATITYPVHPKAQARRFLLEAYPLAAMLPGCALAFAAGANTPYYELALTFKDGRQHNTQVFAPNRVHVDHLGATLLSPTGWLRITDSGQSPVQQKPRQDRAETTDYEQIFARVLQVAQAHPWPAQEPYFERLNIRVNLAAREQALPLPHEIISLQEALHEDLYFSLMEVFQLRSGRTEGDRRLQPGQIVPDVRSSGGAPSLQISVSRFDAPAQDRLTVLVCDEVHASPETVGTLGAAPHPIHIAAALEALGGEVFSARSRQGRIVQGVYQAGTDAAVLISAGQHANETSGIVGALRAAQILQAESRMRSAHFALIALENPDGYAVHRELRARHPLHMHHAARYTALGDDVEYRDSAPLYEREARDHALTRSGAQLHINLHGYPAHEWTRPLTGYVPRGFELWTIPKGFFLILRHQPGWSVECRALLEQLTEALAKVSGLSAYNARQMALYERHAGPLPFEIMHGCAFTQTETTRPGAPITLITEFPDETVEGDAFRFAHTVQMETVLAATRAWQRLARR